MIKEILLPDLGEGIDGAEVSEVTVSIGDEVSVDDTLLVLESDKASMEIPAEDSGVIKEVLVSPGDNVNKGTPLIVLEVVSKGQLGGEQGSQPEQPEQPEQLEQTEQTKAEQSSQLEQLPALKTSKNIFASPGVRRLARELEINLQMLSGSGPKGRITKDDLNRYIKIQMAVGSGVAPTMKKEIDFSKRGDVEVQKLTKINKITGKRLQSAWQEIPHVTQYNTADITELELFRKKLKKAAEKDNVKITFLPFLLRAASIVLEEMPRFNSSLDHKNENLILKNYFHIGVAIDTPNGLIVPSVKDVNNKTIFNLSKELMDISQRAREKKLKHNELTGSTFTVSSLGGIGGTAFSPIVNPPEVAILGVSKSEWRPVYYKETRSFEPRYIMPFCVSYDHRVIDGASAAAFTTRLSKVLSDLESFKD